MWPSWNCRASGVPDPWHISTGAIMTFSDAFSQSPGTFPLPLNRYRGRNSVTVCSRRTVARWNPISASQSADNCLMDWPSSWTGLTQIGRVPDDARLQMKECDRRGDYKRRGRGSVNSRCRSAPSDVYCLSARLDIAVSAHCSMNVSRVRPSCYWAVIQRWQLLYRCGGCCCSSAASRVTGVSRAYSITSCGSDMETENDGLGVVTTDFDSTTTRRLTLLTCLLWAAALRPK